MGYGYFYEALFIQKIKSEAQCLPDRAVFQCENTVQKHKETDHSCRKQHPCVPAKPSEIQADLLTKVPPETAAGTQWRRLKGWSVF